jgi:NADH-quinone oxidoreductase subunit J
MESAIRGFYWYRSVQFLWLTKKLMVSTTVYYIFGFFLLVSSTCVITASSAVFSLIFLILSFLSASVILLLLGADFLGLIILVIYVGAIAVLFLFALMVVETKLATTKHNVQSSAAPIGVVFGLLLLLPTIQSLGAAALNDTQEYTAPLTRVFDFIDVVDAYNLGKLLYNYFAVQITMVGMILLVVLVSVSKLTSRGAKKTRTQSVFKQLSRKPRIG